MRLCDMSDPLVPLVPRAASEVHTLRCAQGDIRGGIQAFGKIPENAASPRHTAAPKRHRNAERARLNRDGPAHITTTLSTTYIQRRARDSNPDGLAPAGFQVG